MQRMRRDFKKNKKKNQLIEITTPHGKLSIHRNVDYCTICGKTIGQCDELLGICEKHRITKDYLEIVTYVAQMIPGFNNMFSLIKLS